MRDLVQGIADLVEEMRALVEDVGVANQLK
jgi:hypothetical protein